MNEINLIRCSLSSFEIFVKVKIFSILIGGIDATGESEQNNIRL